MGEHTEFLKNPKPNLGFDPRLSAPVRSNQLAAAPPARMIDQGIPMVGANGEDCRVFACIHTGLSSIGNDIK